MRCNVQCHSLAPCEVPCRISSCQNEYCAESRAVRQTSTSPPVITSNCGGCAVHQWCRSPCQSTSRPTARFQRSSMTSPSTSRCKHVGWPCFEELCDGLYLDYAAFDAPIDDLCPWQRVAAAGEGRTVNRDWASSVTNKHRGLNECIGFTLDLCSPPSTCRQVGVNSRYMNCLRKQVT